MSTWFNYQLQILYLSTAVVIKTNERKKTMGFTMRVWLSCSMKENRIVCEFMSFNKLCIRAHHSKTTTPFMVQSNG